MPSTSPAQGSPARWVPNTQLTLTNATDTEAVNYSISITDPRLTRTFSRNNIASSTKSTQIN